MKKIKQRHKTTLLSVCFLPKRNNYCYYENAVDRDADIPFAIVCAFMLCEQQLPIRSTYSDSQIRQLGEKSVEYSRKLETGAFPC